MRIFGYAIKHILRSPGLSISVISVLTLIILFIHILFFAQRVIGIQIDNAVERLPITLYLEEDYDLSHSDVIRLMNDIQKVDTNIVIDPISDSQALERMIARFPDLATVLESSDENPLPTSIVITLQLDLYDSVNSVIQQYDHVYTDTQRWKISDYSEQYRRINDVIWKLRAVQTMVFFMIGLFAFSLMVVIYMTIGNYVFFHQDQIHITRLVGWSSHFVHGPFVLQGWLYALMSAALGWFCFRSGLWLIDSLQQILTNMLSGSLYAPEIFAGQIILLVGFWCLSGWLAAHRFVYNVK